MDRKKVIIIGSGPAGHTAAIYAARANLSPVVFEGFFSGLPGGQLMTTTDVENYPGFSEGILGPSLMEEFKKQAIRFGANYLQEDVESIDLSKRPYHIHGKKNQFEADAIIIATGANAKRLYIPGTNDGELWQKGVTACAVCDGAMPIFRNKDLYVIGGGDTAVEEAVFLTKYAKHVYMVHRRDELRASKVMAKRAMTHEKISILWNRVLVKVEGGQIVERVILKDVETNEEEQHQAGGIFFALGHDPNTKFLDNQLTVDNQGYIIVEKGTTKTSVEGVFACGDVQDPIYRQAVTAAGTGCMAAIEVERWFSEKGLN